MPNPDGPDFEGKQRRQARIDAALAQYRLDSLYQARQLCTDRGFDPYEIVRETQPISFENARWAYVLGAAIAIQNGDRKAAHAAESLGIGLQAFCVPGSVADQRQVGIGHGKLAARLLSEESGCFCFLAGHESFAAAEGAIKIAQNANRVRTAPLRVILNGLGKDPAYQIARVNGFTYVHTQLDYATGELQVVSKRSFSQGTRGQINCYGSDDVVEAVAIMHLEQVDISITGNSTNAARFQHPVAGTYKKERTLLGKPYFSVASGGGTGRTMHPDNVGAGPASYGLTDTMGRMHSDAQFAGSSSVPAHVEMMGLIGMGNNPMVGASVATAVAVEKSFDPD
ncbi:MAG: GGGtGRT protein [Actinomycetes bacterium]